MSGDGTSISRAKRGDAQCLAGSISYLTMMAGRDGDSMYISHEQPATAMTLFECLTNKTIMYTDFCHLEQRNSSL